MTDQRDKTATDREALRLKRLREALRENLKRRKSQARGRNDKTIEQANGKPDGVGISDDAE